MEIIEAGDLKFSKLKSTATFQSSADDNVIQLPRPIFIKPESFYQISINCEQKYWFHSYRFYETEEFGSGAEINFHFERPRNGLPPPGCRYNNYKFISVHPSGLFKSLEFIRI